MDLGCLPPDLIVDILSRLPVKFLCQCKCVSKQWLSLISTNPHFRAIHHKRSKKNPLFLFLSYDGNTFKHSITDLAGQVLSEFIALSCDFSLWSIDYCGLLCFVCSKNYAHVYNPSTLEFKTLPHSPHSYHCRTFKSISFGYLPSTNEYKAVRFFPRNDEDKGDGGAAAFDVGCEIFTLKDGVEANSGSWRAISDCPCVVSWRSAICVNGAIYWVVADKNYRLNGKEILSLDLEEEEFKFIPCPQSNECDVDNNPSLLYFVEMKGLLCLSRGRASTVDLWIDVWMLKDCVNGIWVKEYSISLFAVGLDMLIWGYVPTNDHDGEIVMYRKNPQNLFYYNIKKKSLRRVEMSSVEGLACPGLYFDNLFSLGTR